MLKRRVQTKQNLIKSSKITFNNLRIVASIKTSTKIIVIAVMLYKKHLLQYSFAKITKNLLDLQNSEYIL
jgi:hypothetical protein